MKSPDELRELVDAALDRLPLTEELGDDGNRVLRLAPRRDPEHVVVHLDPWDLEGGDDQGGHAVAGHHQHGEPLEGHGLVADQPWEVGPHRQEAGVDVALGHGGPDPGEAVGVHRGRGYRPAEVALTPGQGR